MQLVETMLLSEVDDLSTAHSGAALNDDLLGRVEFTHAFQHLILGY